MKPTEKLESEIEAIAEFAHSAFEWAWKHEDQAYREGTFESVCYSLSNYIDSINNVSRYINGGSRLLFTGMDVADELKLSTSKHCPNANKIKRMIKVKSGAFDA